MFSKESLLHEAPLLIQLNLHLLVLIFAVFLSHLPLPMRTSLPIRIFADFVLIFLHFPVAQNQEGLLLTDLQLLK